MVCNKSVITVVFLIALLFIEQKGFFSNRAMAKESILIAFQKKLIKVGASSRMILLLVNKVKRFLYRIYRFRAHIRPFFERQLFLMRFRQIPVLFIHLRHSAHDVFSGKRLFLLFTFLLAFLLSPIP